MLSNTSIVTRNARAIFLFSKHKFSAEVSAERDRQPAVARRTELEASDISNAIKLQPKLSVFRPDVWERAHRNFTVHGLDTVQFLRIATGNPDVMTRHPKKIIESMESWRQCQFGEYFTLLLLTKYPGLLDVEDRAHFVRHISKIRNYVETKKNVWKILMNSPDLMQQSEEVFGKKFRYLRLTMRVLIPDIVKSSALSHDLFHIRCRHIFLERLGLFVTPHVKTNPDKPTKNPRVYRITDTSDKKFATDVCHVSIDEYDTFKELYARELKESDKENLHDDDDDDDEQDSDENE